MERDPYFLATEQLMTLVSEGNKLGKQAKEVLLRVLENDLPELPEIRAYDPESSWDHWKTIRALPVEPGGLGAQIDRLTSRPPAKDPLIAMTNEGIFEVPLTDGRLATHVWVYVADWENKIEIEPLEYLTFSPKVLEAIRLESEKPKRTTESVAQL